MAERQTIEVPDDDLESGETPFDRLKAKLKLPELPRTAVISSYYEPVRKVTVFEVVA